LLRGRIQAPVLLVYLGVRNRVGRSDETALGLVVVYDGEAFRISRRDRNAFYDAHCKALLTRGIIFIPSRNVAYPRIAH
jgi:hypothetical protein